MKFTAIGENHLYSKVYAKGKKAAGRLCVVYVLPDLRAKKLAAANPQKCKINRIGLTVSKKLGGAVERNRCKRIIREGWRAVERERGVRCGFLVVIAARAAAFDAKSTEIKKDLEHSLEKIGMLL
ncbi:MAG: ribonuclease P protein component [Clostridia bacterium]|nr:ribonuclease P protein component [Clostridia bacterium]